MFSFIARSLVLHFEILIIYQWRIQDFPQGGAPIPKLGLFCQFFAENCMKMKEFGPPGGARVPGAPPLRSANVYIFTDRKGKVMFFTGICLSTICLMATRSLLGLVTARSVRILLECFLLLTFANLNHCYEI